MDHLQHLASKSTALGDIDTGRCYRKTYNDLVKNVGVDMILPCILAMDKTHIDFGLKKIVA